MNQPNLFKYVGGKYKIASNIIQMFPTHHCYVDVFGGAGNVLIQKPPSKIEIFNDLNSDIYNLFKILQTRYNEFIQRIKYVIYSRELYKEYVEKLKSETDMFERAVMWYVVACQSFGGRHSTAWGISKTKNEAASWMNKINQLDTIVNRIKRVHIENHDFDYILSTYDGTNTFFYLDPPYLPETRKSKKFYVHEMSLDDHKRMLDTISNVKAKVMLSGYPSQLYDELDWVRHDINVNCDVVGRTRASQIQGSGIIKEKHQRVECVYMNYSNEGDMFDEISELF